MQLRQWKAEVGLPPRPALPPPQVGGGGGGCSGVHTTGLLLVDLAAPESH